MKTFIKLAVLMTFLMTFVSLKVWIKTRITTQGYALVESRMQKEELQEELDRLKIQKEKIMGFDTLKKMATQYKSFQQPEDYQLEYLEFDEARVR